MAAKNKVSAMMEEFKNFAFKGNVVDLAIGVIIGAAFGKIVDSLVKHIIMPLVSVVIPGEQGYLGWKFQRAGADVDKVFDAEAIKLVAHHAKFEFQVNGEKVVAGPPLRVQNIAARLMNKADEIGENKVTTEVVSLIAK